MRGCLGGYAWLLGGVHGCYAWLLLGGGLWLLGGCMVAPGGGGGMHGCSSGGKCMVAPRAVCVVAPGGHAWDTMRYGDTVNERAVRILLSILVFIAVVANFIRFQNNLLISRD